MAQTHEHHIQAVTVSLQELRDDSVSLETLEEAFGQDSLGIIIVHGLPHEFAHLRRKLLSLSSYLANLPEDKLAKLERPDAKVQRRLVLWERDSRRWTKARTLYPDLLAFVAPNTWPDQSILPDFQETFESLCRLIVNTAALVARACDRYGVARLDGYQPGTLEDIVRQSVSTKARLLHYFPPQTARSDSAVGVDDDWCATHYDLGALTGLTGQFFVDEEIHKPKAQPDGSLPLLAEMDSHPDAKAGLWIKDRSGRTTQVDIPKDCLGFQTGMALQLITRGRFRAVPHFVRGAAPSKTGRIARNTLAVFTQPNLWEKVDETRDFATLAQEIINGTYDDDDDDNNNNKNKNNTDNRT